MRATTRIMALAAVLALAPAHPLADWQGQAGRSSQDNLPPRVTQKPPLHGAHWMAITGKPR
jgi:hypothetical protein